MTEEKVNLVHEEEAPPKKEEPVGTHVDDPSQFTAPESVEAEAEEVVEEPPEDAEPEPATSSKMLTPEEIRDNVAKEMEQIKDAALRARDQATGPVWDNIRRIGRAVSDRVDAGIEGMLGKRK